MAASFENFAYQIRVDGRNVVAESMFVSDYGCTRQCLFCTKIGQGEEGVHLYGAPHAL